VSLLLFYIVEAIELVGQHFNIQDRELILLSIL